MAQSQIRWKRGDYITLGKSVALYNRTINEHRTLENSLYLPDNINYQDIKENITTRQELNRVIASLRRITYEDSLELYETDARRTINKLGKTRTRNTKRNSKKKIKCRIKSFKYTR